MRQLDSVAIKLIIERKQNSVLYFRTPEET